MASKSISHGLSDALSVVEPDDAPIGRPDMDDRGLYDLRTPMPCTEQIKRSKVVRVEPARESCRQAEGSRKATTCQVSISHVNTQLMEARPTHRNRDAYASARMTCSLGSPAKKYRQLSDITNQDTQPSSNVSRRSSAAAVTSGHRRGNSPGCSVVVWG